jgi:hypothetical protein
VAFELVAAAATPLAAFEVGFAPVDPVLLAPAPPAAYIARD